MSELLRGYALSVHRFLRVYVNRRRLGSQSMAWVDEGCIFVALQPPLVEERAGGMYDEMVKKMMEKYGLEPWDEVSCADVAGRMVYVVRDDSRWLVRGEKK